MFYLRFLSLTLIFSALLISGQANAEEVSATMYKTMDSAMNSKLGTVSFADDKDGIAITVNLQGLPPGAHGFHVHEKPDCSAMMQDGNMVHALAAGGHYDPEKTGRHLGPEGGGHKGDLPVLTVKDDGKVNQTMHVKGIKTSDFKGRSVMIHAGGDNYSDIPLPLGGGGARIACGIID